MSHENPAYYAIIPANVRYDKRLKAMERILYGEITALANKMGYCTAKNKYFGDLYDVHQNTAGGWINRLEKFGYIRTELIYDGKQIIGRRIYISDAIPSTRNRKNTETNPDDLNEKIDTPVNEKIDTPVNEKIDTPVNEKIDTLSTKRLKINNTRLNITRDEADAPARAAESIQVDDVNRVDDVTDNPSSDGLMFADWQPEELESFRQQLRRAMLPNWESEQVQMALVEFVSYWQTRSETNSNSGWTHKFLQNLMRLKAQGAMVAKKTSDPSHRRFADKTTTPTTTPAATPGMRPLGKM